MGKKESKEKPVLLEKLLSDTTFNKYQLIIQSTHLIKGLKEKFKEKGIKELLALALQEILKDKHKKK